MIRYYIIAYSFLIFAASSQAITPTQFSGQYDLKNRELSRQLYRLAYVPSSHVTPEWTGNIFTCDAGSTSQEYVDATLRRINWFRAMSGVPSEVTVNSVASAKASQAALMMSANNSLSHYPDPSWLCYSSEGSEAASKSNIALGYVGAESITAQFEDRGAFNAGVGHRRWLQYPITPSMGIGNVHPFSHHGVANTVWVMDFLDLPEWWSIEPVMRDGFVAWPPPGYVPYQTVYPRWSFSYPNADFSNAIVKMLVNGQPLSVKLEPIQDRMGLNTLVWLPAPYQDYEKWLQPDADTLYTVEVSQVRLNGVAINFTYDVIVFDPEVKNDSEYADLIRISSAQTTEPNSAVSFKIPGIDWSDDYHWRVTSVERFEDVYFGQSDLAGLSVHSSGGYSTLQASRKVSEPFSYHMAHPVSEDQYIQLTSQLVPSLGAQLTFDSYLGFATDRQVAVVEASLDSVNWMPLWQQAGSGAPVSDEFTQQVVDLSEYADQPIFIRFRYALTGNGSYYRQTSSNVGWLIDNIGLTGMLILNEVTNELITEQPQAKLSFFEEGTYVVQVRPRFFGGFMGDWSHVSHLFVSEDFVVPISARRNRRLPLWIYGVEK